MRKRFSEGARDRLPGEGLAAGKPHLHDAVGVEVLLGKFIKIAGKKQAGTGSFHGGWRVNYDDIEFPRATTEVTPPVINNDAPIGIVLTFFRIRMVKSKGFGHAWHQFHHGRINPPT